MTILTIETKRGKVEYSLFGQGKPILFVHGGHVNCRETIFRKGLDPSEFSLIMPSRPGYGYTPLTESNKTPEGTASLFMALMDELNLPKIIVIGISAGGLIALEIAANYPERVESLVLMSALTKKWFAETDKVYRGAKRIFAPNVEHLAWIIYRLSFRFFPNQMTRVMFKELSKYRPVEYTEGESKELRQMTLNMRSGYGFVNDLDQNIDQEILSRIECPVLILHSENDNAVNNSHPQNARARIKKSRLVTFKNHWGHLLWIGEDYQPILEELKQHIQPDM